MMMMTITFLISCGAPAKIKIYISMCILHSRQCNVIIRSFWLFHSVRLTVPVSPFLFSSYVISRGALGDAHRSTMVPSPGWETLL